MRNKFVYSCSIKSPYFRIWKILGKHFLLPLGWSVFPAKSCWDAWRSGSQLARGQVKWQMRQNLVAQLFNIWSVGCTMCLRALSWRIGPFLWTRIGCRRCSFWCISLICWAFFSDIMVSPGFRKLRWITAEEDHQQWPRPFFDSSMALGSVFELLLSPATELVIAVVL